jgi:hypothetical protein
VGDAQFDFNVQWANHVVLMTTQAMLGLISPAITAVAIDAKPDHVIVYFAVNGLTDGVREDIEEIVTDLDAFLVPATLEVAHEIFDGPPDENWPGHSQRVVFLAKLTD